MDQIWIDSVLALTDTKNMDRKGKARERVVGGQRDGAGQVRLTGSFYVCSLG